MIGESLFIKFGKFHGQKGVVVGTTEKKGFPAFYMQLLDGTIIKKRQRNTIRMVLKR